MQTMAEMPMEQMEPASRGLFSPVVATVIAPYATCATPAY